ncbi:hypothetical protein FHS18_002880 [Paenibacillus phyllosphaerae]|uniref:Uncharacterized protein n=1 Tax=Paenibacillus phyllosphaerae TaxID=274593 RepID=A0A7W5AXZ9_9BACL|nr:hypothetical protein [Paenibacillus phyllosphaerae]MBB3110813.1 hypothetical protein [Paenibacillus phyllosphaerae]
MRVKNPDSALFQRIASPSPADSMGCRLTKEDLVKLAADNILNE